MSGIIFVCDVCLEELIISQGDFEPINLEEMVEKAPQAEGWYIPPLVGYCEEKKHYFETPISDIRSLCPRHHFLRVLERRIDSLKMTMKKNKKRTIKFKLDTTRPTQLLRKQKKEY
jgi:hypothetical protein